MDLLRRDYATGRRWRWWDRGQWLCGVIIAVLLISVASFSSAQNAFGTDRPVHVRSCSTTYDLSGRFVHYKTTCDVSVPAGPLSGDQTIDTASNHASGSTLVAKEWRNTLSDPDLNGGYGWLLWVGLTVLATTWWFGLPRVDRTPDSGKHLAPHSTSHKATGGRMRVPARLGRFLDRRV